MNQVLFIGLVILHIFVCLLLIGLILIQNDKGGGLAGAFGGMGGGAAFTGSSAATFITRLTQWAAAVSFAILIGLNVLSTKGIESGHRESELKGAHHGLSAVIPPEASPVNGGGAPAIPGLGNGAAGNSENTPASAPASAPATGAPQGK